MIGVHKQSLGTDVIKAIAQAKTDFRLNKLQPHNGDTLIVPHANQRGGKLLEAYVGQARPEDLAGEAGKRRLVLKIEAGQITEMYFSNNHYRTGSWARILDF